MPKSSPRARSKPAGLGPDPFRLLVESVADHAIYALDTGGLITTWTPAAERIYGYAAAEVIGRPFGTLYSREHVQDGRTDEGLQRALNDGHCKFESFQVRKDQSRFWSIISVSAIKDADGRHAGYGIVARDITQRRRAEDGVHPDRDLSAAILSSLPGIFYMYDETRRFRRWNPRFESVTGYSGDEVANLDPLDLFEGEHKTRVAERIMAVFRDGEAEVEAELVSRDGRRTPYWFNGIRAEIAGVRCLLGMGIDISTRKQADAELRRTGDLLRAVADGTTDAVFVKDREGRYLLINPAASRFVGKEARDVLGRDDTAIFDANSARVVMDHDRRVMESNRTDTEEELLTAAGVTRTYLATKAPYHDADGNIIGVVGISRDITDRKRAADELEQNRALLRVSSRVGRMGAWAVELEGLKVIWSEDLLTILELPPDAKPDFDYGINIYLEQYRPVVRAAFEQCVAIGTPFDVEVQAQTAKGRTLWVRIIGEATRNADGTIAGARGGFQDISDRVRLETQFRQAQKMEAVGQLAGGVAHDFNNLLTVINGCSDLLLLELGPDDPTRDMLSEIHAAGKRAGTLTRQLLTFSRQQVLAPQVLDLNAIVTDTEKMLRRLIGEDILLATKLSPDLAQVKADPGQVEQVLLNLAVNARDAMPTGGSITIETSNVRLDEAFCRPFDDLAPGAYVLIAVRDTGTGMDEATLTRIFEPFFTTKGQGKGTGLGLATVHGIVKQARGHIAASSEVGRGTTFSVYLPQESGPASRSQSDEAPAGMPRGTETVLLVEDEGAVRALATLILRRCGYSVLEATNGQDALRLCDETTAPIHLLISDVVMPHLGARELAQRVTAMRPGCRVLFISGYTDDAVIRHGVLEAEFAFLQKPFTPVSLAQKVRSVLDVQAC